MKRDARLDGAKVEQATARLEAIWRTIAESRGEQEEDWQWEADHIKRLCKEVREEPPATLEGLLGRHEPGDPVKNGALVWLAGQLLEPPARAITVTSLDDLEEIEIEGFGRFHHGDVEVKGDFDGFEHVAITGSLRVEETLWASYLDAMLELHVGGSVEAERAYFMGHLCVFGSLHATELVGWEPQGGLFVLGELKTPYVIVNEASDLEGTPLSTTATVIALYDLDERPEGKRELGQVLEVPVFEGDEDVSDVLFRALGVREEE